MARKMYFFIGVCFRYEPGNPRKPPETPGNPRNFAPETPVPEPGIFDSFFEPTLLRKRPQDASRLFHGPPLGTRLLTLDTIQGSLVSRVTTTRFYTNPHKGEQCCVCQACAQARRALLPLLLPEPAQNSHPFGQRAIAAHGHSQGRVCRVRP